MFNGKLIEIKNLTFRYNSRDKPVLEYVNFNVKRGECVLICGQSGTGKSTLLYLLNGLIPHVIKGDIKGEISVSNTIPKNIPVSILSRKVGTIFQNPDNQLFMAKVYDDVAFGCENLKFSKDKIIKKVELAILQTGLWEKKDKEVNQLSGGQKQRTAIAGIFAMGPEILLMDEPTADLDIEGRKECIDIVKKLKKNNHTIIIATHLYKDFLSLADCVYHIDSRNLKKGLPEDSTLLNKITKRNCICNKDSLISLKDVTIKYNSDIAVRNITLDIKRGETVAIVGPNGSGKTTIFNAVCGLLGAAGGTISVCRIENPKLDDLIGKIGYLLQNPNEQLFEESVEKEIYFGPKNLKLNINVDEYLKIVGMDFYRNYHPQTLSHGEKQRLAFVSLFAVKPEVFILDEPTSGLDEHNWIKLMKMVKSHTPDDTAVIFSTHNEKAVKYFADRVIYLKNGEIVDEKLLR